MIVGAGATAVVTGASSGIGLAIARALGNDGATVVGIGRDEASLESARIAAGLEPERYLARVVDLASPEQVATVAEELARALPRVDVLVHSAAEYHAGEVSVSPVDTLRRLMQVNVLAPYELTRALMPGLVAARGQVVFVNSSVLRSVGARTALFAATKAALHAVADGLRAEVNGCGVRVLSVYPGRTATATQERIFATEGRRYEPARLLQAEDVATTVVSALHMPRTAEVTDLHVRPLQKWN